MTVYFDPRKRGHVLRELHDCIGHHVFAEPDHLGFMYGIKDIANAGDNEKYPATVIVERQPNNLTDKFALFAIEASAFAFEERVRQLLIYPEGEVPYMHDSPRVHVKLDDAAYTLTEHELRYSIWQHKSNAFYTIDALANLGGYNGLPQTIVYRNLTTGALYAGASDDWLRRMTLVCLNTKADARRLNYYIGLEAAPRSHQINTKPETTPVIAYPPMLVVYLASPVGSSNRLSTVRAVEPVYRSTLKMVVEALNLKDHHRS